MMREFRKHLLIMLAIFFLPSLAYAQDEEFKGGGTMDFEAEAEAEAEAESEPLEGDGVSEADMMSALGEGPEEGTEDATASEDDSSKKKQEIWAVQQVYALRAGRLDLQPSVGISMNDPYVQHISINLGASYFITEVLAIGLSFNFYRWMQGKTDLNFRNKRATHQTVPINEYFWGGQLNFSYVPVYGKFALLKEWIIHWDIWVVGGGGIIYTRPEAAIDKEYREFDFNMKFSFNIGIGLRFFLTRFSAIFIELRDYIFPEQLESLVITDDPTDKTAWLDDGTVLTNNVMIQFGLSLFIPFTFEYKLPK